MKKVIFFLRHNNDIDHITPVIHKLLDYFISVDIIITTKSKLLEDYRIKYLKEKMKGTNSNIFHFGYFSKRESYIKFYLSYYKQAVICFDWVADDFTRTVCRIANELGFPTVALPHGDEPYWNIIQREDDISFNEALSIYKKQHFFDYIVVPNELCARRYEYRDNVKVLGSPRFCDEWLPIHDKIKQNIHITNGRIVVVMFIRNKHWNINWSELVTAIKLITQFPYVYLIVKNHPRGKMTYNFGRHPWMSGQSNLLIDDMYNSSSLIDIADIILDVGTSICWESIKKNKPTYMLEYLHGNTSTIARYNPSSIIHNRDELYNIIKHKYRSYDFPTNKRERFLNDIIYYPDKNVLERYVNFLGGLLDDKP